MPKIDYSDRCTGSYVCTCSKCQLIDRELIAKYGSIDKFHKMPPEPTKLPDPSQTI